MIVNLLAKFFLLFTCIFFALAAGADYEKEGKFSIPLMLISCFAGLLAVVI